MSLVDHPMISAYGIDLVKLESYCLLVEMVCLPLLVQSQERSEKNKLQADDLKLCFDPQKLSLISAKVISLFHNVTYSIVFVYRRL